MVRTIKSDKDVQEITSYLGAEQSPLDLLAHLESLKNNSQRFHEVFSSMGAIEWLKTNDQVLLGPVGINPMGCNA